MRTAPGDTNASPAARAFPTSPATVLSASGGFRPVASATHRLLQSSDRPSEGPGLSIDGTVPVTCLGCGCTCDDVRLTLVGGAIRAITPACDVAAAWAGDGRMPADVRVLGQAAPRDAALDAIATLLRGSAERTLVVLAPGLPTAAYGEAVGLADALGAALETPHSAHAADWVLAGQRRGRAVATLGELRHRADLVVYWGVDPAAQWPRFRSRYGDASPSLHAGERAVVSVSIGADRSPQPDGVQVTIAPEDELPALGLMRSVLRGGAADAVPHLQGAVDLVRRMAAARYVSIVTTADASDAARHPARAEALLALAQQLNGPTSRCALTLLRPGGNVAGIESLVTWQTGFPFAVDFATGMPAYAPTARGAVRAAEGAFTAALVVGDVQGLPAAVREAALALPHAVIGPRASVHAPAAAASIDTGLAGLHEAGTAYRMDDVPLPVEASLPHPHPSEALLAALAARLARPGAPA